MCDCLPFGKVSLCSWVLFVEKSGPLVCYLCANIWQRFRYVVWHELLGSVVCVRRLPEGGGFQVKPGEQLLAAHYLEEHFGNSCFPIWFSFFALSWVQVPANVGKFGRILLFKKRSLKWMDNFLSVLLSPMHMRRWTGVEGTKLKAGSGEEGGIASCHQLSPAATSPRSNPNMLLHVVSAFKCTVSGLEFFYFTNAVIHLFWL